MGEGAAVTSRQEYAVDPAEVGVVVVLACAEGGGDDGKVDDVTVPAGYPWLRAQWSGSRWGPV